MIWLVACTADPTDPEPTDTAPDDGPVLAPLVPASAPCPDLTAPGEVVFRVAGVDRRVLVAFPADRPPGMPVLSVWHGLGQSPERMFDQMELAAFAEDHRMVVAAPSSTTATGPSWDVYTGGVDAILYDDLRTCLSEQLDVDLAQVATAGFSFGAWWVVWLAENRGDTLSAVHLMSGGVHPDTVEWASPAWKLPFLVTWGGPDDVYDDDVGHHFVFSETSADLAAAARAEGHVVVSCEHDGGHAIPDQVVTLNDAWFPVHRFGEPSPFAEGTGGLPSICEAAP